MKHLLLAALMFTATGAVAQEIATADPLKKHTWKAQWIADPAHSLTEYGVFHFRKTFNLSKSPEKMIVHVSADNRYRLFVNGVAVATGPAVGDLHHWHYESVDIARYLKAGKNVVAAQVYNMGEHRPGRQISFKTGFILQSEEGAEADISTNDSWKVMTDTSYSVLPVTPQTMEHYYPVLGFYTAGPGDRVDGAKYPWGWQETGFDESRWSKPRIVRDDAVNTGVGPGFAYGSSRFLVPRPISLQEESEERIMVAVRTHGISLDPTVFMNKKKIVVPARTSISVLLDAKRMSMGYPELTVSAGRGASIKITYAESLFDKDFKKGNRNEISDKTIYGLHDLFIADGGVRRTFRPLYLRAFRYIQLDIQTQSDELVIDDYYNNASAYPLKQVASFESSDTSLKNILDAGWRTLYICAQDNLYSDAYVEQMSYIGDARTHALALYYMSGNEDLFRHAIRQFDYSRIPEGLTQSRYPARELQVIPSYSLVWIDMLHDYMMIRNDHAFARTFIPGIRSVLYWFRQRVDSNGLLTNLTWWYFPDREADKDGRFPDHSALATLQYSDALQKAAEIFREIGLMEEADEYLALSRQLNDSVYKLCFREQEGMFAESPAADFYTQGTNAMAIVAGAIPGAKREALLQKILSDERMKEATLYYKFYVSRAIEKGNDRNGYFGQLWHWREMLRIGMTAFGEVAKDPRSDCHPWSANPNIDFFRVVCGVIPASFGYRSVNIAPAPGPLTFIKARIPHPDGSIIVDLKKTAGGGIQGMLTLPPGVKGKFRWKDRVIEWNGGAQAIQIR